MKDELDKVDEILSDTNKLQSLLLLEKEGRGLDKDELVFIGTANVANFYWCSLKSVLQSRFEELMFFAAYLEDRLRYSLELGYIDKIPDNYEKLLEIGDEITFEDIEELLKRIKEEMKEREGTIKVDAIETDKELILSPDLSPEEREFYEREAKKKGMNVAPLDKYPLIRGELLHMLKAEKYPTIRWNFSWKDYVVLGIPDGVTDSFVYEYKTTRRHFLTRFIKPIAFAQADIYGFFFRRRRKRVQIYLMDKDLTETYEEEIDIKNALDTLESFRSIDKEGKKPIPPRRWKCNNCNFKEICPLRGTMKTAP